MADLSTSQTFNTGDQVTAAKMNNIVGNASLLPTSISGKSAKNVADGANDYVLLYDNTTSTLVKASPSSIRNATGSVSLPSNLSVAGTLGVTGASTLSGALGVTGSFSVNTNKATVDAATGNTLIAGTLQVTNVITATGGVSGSLTGNSVGSHNGAVGNITPSTGAFTTINVSGATTLTGAVTATAGVTGNVTGNLTGNVTGSCTGSSGSCTGNSATATTASACSGNSATATTASACSGNSATATNLSTNKGNWSSNGTISAVVGQLAWKNYNNNHTIFDASASTSPDGTAINNTNSQVAWISTHPTLMGWNGASTYGVRVDSARTADSAVNITAYTINQNLATTSNPTFGTVYTGNWFRSNGNTGWYNETHAGGIHMIDATYVRTYGGKQFYCDSNILAGGNVTAYSDERLKRDWGTFGPDMLEKLSEVKSGTYTRIDSGLKQVGVSAQSLQKVMPDAVCEGENGHLTVAYGNAALSACVELAKEVVTLRKRIEVLSSIVDKKQNPELTSNATVTKSTEDK